MEITDQNIKDALVMTRRGKAILNSCRIKTTWLKTHGMYEYVMHRFPGITSIPEIVYRIYHRIPDGYVQHCHTCGKEIPLEFVSFVEGYKKYCSYKCSAGDESKYVQKQSEEINDSMVLSKLIGADGKIIAACCTERKLKELGFYDYIMARYTDLAGNASITQEILYRMANGLERRPVCPVCGKPLPFYRFNGDDVKPGGYRRHCSNKCANADKNAAAEKRNSAKHTIEQKWKDRGYNIKYDGPDNFLVYDQCKTHNPFSIRNHIFFNRIKYPQITLCPICNPERNQTTSIENVVKKILDSYNVKYVQHTRTVIKPKELDFYLPENNIGIECNGIYWHSGLEGKKLAVDKYRLAENSGIQLLTFWEDNILYDTEKVKSIILSHCGLNSRIFARNCEVKELSSKEAGAFIDTYHLQGNVKAKVKLGLYSGGELVEVMTFGHMRRCLGSHSTSSKQWELYRLCAKHGYTVVGGASKLLSYFKRHYEWSTIVSYCHREISSGNVYAKLGFTFDKNCGQGFTYYNYAISNRRINRYKLRKSEIDDGSGRTADDILANKGYLKCYDAGVMKYIIKNKGT